MEPNSTYSIPYLLSKFWFLIGGLFGSAGLGAFGTPKALEGYGKFSKGLIIGGIGGVAPVMFGGLIAQKMGLDPYSADVGMAIGAFVGVFIIGGLGFVAKFFQKREGMDILEVVQEVRASAAPRKTPAKRPTATKRVRAGAAK